MLDKFFDGRLDPYIQTSRGCPFTCAFCVDGSELVTLNQDAVFKGGDGALQFTIEGENSIRIPNNQASALIVEEAGNAYMTFNSTDGSEAITFNQAVAFSGGISNGGTIVGTTITANTSIVPDADSNCSS